MIHVNCVVGQNKSSGPPRVNRSFEGAESAGVEFAHLPQRCLGSIGDVFLAGQAGLIGIAFRRIVELARTNSIKVMPHPFPDHHAFKPEDLDFGDDLPVLMTEKDAVKLRRSPRANWWVLPVTAQVDAAFGEWLTRRLDECRRSKAA